ncbi:MAG: tetratricopeptide repeat protein [Cyanobacteria bacterium CRU_2_1]|nr:tetratricopeptide repeat protein [Cyanobacteria bacterium CRU_2_1]
MRYSLSEWDQDISVNPEETYQSFVRSLQRTEGFGLFFVRCAEGERANLIAQIKADIPQKTIELLAFDRPIADGNLYTIINQLPNKDQINILFITGIEKSLEPYIQPGYGGQGDYYKLDTVPRILGHLNLQRERFRDDFSICFVFLVPLFALKYFMRRAPDFFDWRSGIFEFIPDQTALDQEYSRLMEGDYEQYLTLTHLERLDNIRSIQSLIDEDHQTPETKAALWKEQGNIWFADGNYSAAIDSYNKAIELKPDDHYAWNNRGLALAELGRYEEAIDSYDKALEFLPDHTKAIYNKACSYARWNKVEESIENLQKAIALNPECREWAKTDKAFDGIRADDRFQALRLL